MSVTTFCQWLYEQVIQDCCLLSLLHPQLHLHSTHITDLLTYLLPASANSCSNL